MPKIFSKHYLLGAVLTASILAGSLALPASAAAVTDQAVQSAAQAGVDYLANNQNADGSIAGYGGESDWSAVAIEASGQNSSSISSGGASLADFLAADTPTGGTPATAIERKIIAVSAIGGDSANFGGVNYADLLSTQHVDNQIGSPTLLNDDIFGVIAIASSGETDLSEAAQDGLNYFLSHQNSDGGFSYTTESCAYCGSDSNDTAAAIIAMYAAEKLALTFSNTAAKGSALIYLLSTQQADGGFGYDIYSPSDGSSTAWGLMALNTIGEAVSAQAKLAREWLLNNQNSDGGFSFGAYGITASDTFTTAHAVTALLGSTWLLSPTPLSVQQPAAGMGGGQNTSTASSSAPTISTVSSSTTQSKPSRSDAGLGQKAAAASLLASADIGKKSISLEQTSNNSPWAKYAASSLLVLGAVSWFVLESRKARGVN